MTDAGLTNTAGRPTRGVMKKVRMAAVGGAMMVAAGLVTGCVNVTAPDKPIVINLNINITQQVVYRLDGQAKALIQSNPGIF